MLTSADGAAQATIEVETGLVRRVRTFARDNSVRREIHQLGSLLNGEDVPFPKSTLAVRYSATGFAEHVCLLLLAEAEFNCDISDNEFSQGVSSGQTVVDFRRDSRMPRVVVAAQASTDVLSNYTGGGSRKATERRPPGHPHSGATSIHVTWVVVGNAVIVLVVLALLYYRRVGASRG